MALLIKSSLDVSGDACQEDICCWKKRNPFSFVPSSISARTYLEVAKNPKCDTEKEIKVGYLKRGGAKFL